MRKEKPMEGFDELLGRYTVTDNDDGTKNLLGVPIFEIGFKRGDRVYDDEWADKAIKAHNDIKAGDGYVPPVFIGHTKEDEEKPATGHFDNLRKQGKKLLADLVKVPGKIYEEIRGGMWPNRSIEAINTKSDSRVLGLALLGSSTPACKFGPIQFDGNPEDIDQVKYVDEFADAVATGLTYNQLSQKIATVVEMQLEAVSNANLSTAVLEKADVYVRAIYITKPVAIVQWNDNTYSCMYVIGDDNSVGVTNLIEVEEQYMPIIQRQLDVAEENDINKNMEVIMTDDEKKEADLKAAEDAKALEAEKAEEAEKLKAEEKVKADKEAADKLKEDLDKNEKDQMSETIVALKAEVTKLSERADKAAEDKDIAEIDSWIKGANLKGNLPKAAIEFKGAENGMALRDTLIAATPEVRADIQAFVDNLKSVVKFTETAVAGDEEGKEGDSPEAMEQKLSDLTDAYIEEHKGISASKAMDAVVRANPDIEKYLDKALPHFKE